MSVLVTVLPSRFILFRNQNRSWYGTQITQNKTQGIAKNMYKIIQNKYGRTSRPLSSIPKAAQPLWKGSPVTLFNSVLTSQHRSSSFFRQSPAFLWWIEFYTAVHEASRFPSHTSRLQAFQCRKTSVIHFKKFISITKCLYGPHHAISEFEKEIPQTLVYIIDNEISSWKKDYVKMIRKIH